MLKSSEVESDISKGYWGPETKLQDGLDNFNIGGCFAHGDQKKLGSRSSAIDARRERA